MLLNAASLLCALLIGFAAHRATLWLRQGDHQ